MKKTIKIKMKFSSNQQNTQEREYYIDDKQVSELEYYDLHHLKDVELHDLHNALQQCRSEEPADFTLFQDWQIKCALIEELITKKVGHRFWADFTN